MKVILISTTDLAPGRDVSLNRMIESVSRQIQDGSLKVDLHLLVQCAQDGFKAGMFERDSFVRLSTAAGRLPLSVARNILLAPLLSSGELDADTLVLFPDDDCWFEPGYLANVISLFEADPALGCWFCDFGSRPERGSAPSMAGRTAGARDVVRKAASITLVLRGNVARSVGLYDERLGVGSSNNGGEDTDYAIRAFLACPSTRVTAKTLMGHRDRSDLPSAAYFDGCLIALAKNAHRRSGLAWEFIRKVLVGGVLVWRGEMPATALVGALGKAARSRRARAVPGILRLGPENA